jgi:hypothetical protein
MGAFLLAEVRDSTSSMSTNTRHLKQHIKLLSIYYELLYLEDMAHCKQFTSILHSKQDPIYVFPEMKLRGDVSNFHIHVSVRDSYFLTIAHR